MNRIKTAVVAGLLSVAIAMLSCAAMAQSYIKNSEVWFQQGKISGGISVSNSSLPTALPSQGQQAWICNTGTVDAFIAFGPTNSVVATATGSTWLKAGTCAAYDLQPFATLNKFVAAITASSTTTLTVETGIGTPPSQASGSGGGGGGNVNLNQILGAAPSATNPLWVSPASGAVFPVSASSLPLPTGAATQTTLAALLSVVGSPFQANSSISNTAFGISGTLPAFASTPSFNMLIGGAAPSLGNPLYVLQATGAAFHFICDSGCGGGGGGGLSVPFNGAIGANGTPVGFKDVSGNLQPLLGDVTNGQWVNLKASVTVPVSGTFFQATQPVSAASLPLPTGAATQTTLAGVLTALGSPFQAGGSIGNTAFGISGTLPAFAATPTFNIGTAPTLTVSGTVTANAGTNLNTSLLALESGGNLASVATNTGRIPAQGQALAAASTPVVLTAIQLSALTPPAAITGFALDTSVGTTNTDLGALGSTACATDTGSCNVNAFLQRLAQRLTTINTTLGSPMQASGGSVTANAGTNLNTSLLALEGGGNLASLVTQLGAVTASPTANTIGDRLKTINTTLGTPLQSGGTVAATQSGTWNIGSVTTLPALVAGSAIIGKVGIDQTTPGTTNGVLAKVWDGTNTAAVKAASTAPAATDPAIVVTESPNSPLAPFASYSTASITRPANTTTYTPNTGWNNGTPAFFSFTSACRVNGGQVLIPRIDIWSSANPTLKLTGVLYLFSAVPGTNVSDDATFTIASADFANLTGNFGGFPFTLANNQASGASNSSASITGTTNQAQCASGSTTITGMIEVTNGYVPASGEVLHVAIATSGLN